MSHVVPQVRALTCDRLEVTDRAIVVAQGHSRVATRNGSSLPSSTISSSLKPSASIASVVSWERFSKYTRRPSVAAERRGVCRGSRPVGTLRGHRPGDCEEQRDEQHRAYTVRHP